MPILSQKLIYKVVKFNFVAQLKMVKILKMERKITKAKKTMS